MFDFKSHECSINLYNNFFNVLMEHMNKFEWNSMNTKYKNKNHLSSVNNALKYSLKI